VDNNLNLKCIYYKKLIMEKYSKLRQVIREELMKEINLNRMPQGTEFIRDKALPLYNAVKGTYGLDDKELGQFKMVDAINNIMSFPNGKHKGLFVTLKKPTKSITVNGKTLDYTKWEEVKSTGKDTKGDIFYIINVS
jgi:hypothetical protein